MKKRTDMIAMGGVMSAVALVLLFAASLLPGGRMVILALSSTVGAMVIIRCGLKAGLLSWIAVSVLSLLMLPSKGCAIMYTVFFGPYALVKNLVERWNSAAGRWILKYVFCLVVSVLLFFFSTDVLGLFPPMLAEHIWMFLPVVAIAFLAYDIIFSKMIGYLTMRIPR